MKATYPVQWVPVTPEYILASIQEEWIGGLLYHGPLTLENVNTFRQLAELIIQKQQRYGFGPRPTEQPSCHEVPPVCSTVRLCFSGL